MKSNLAVWLSLFLWIQSGHAEARSLMERFDQILFGRGHDLSAAYEAYDNGKFEEAAKDFAAYASGPQASQVASYNAGVALYKAGKTDDAMKFLQRATLGSDPLLKAKALHNTASIHIDKKELEPARDSLKEALSFDNDNKAILENLEWVEEQLKKEPPKKDQDKKDSQNQADNKDKQDKEKEKQNEEKQDKEQNASNKDQEQNKDGKNQEQKDGKDQKSGEQKSAEEKAAEEKEKKAADSKDKDKAGEKSKEQMAKDEAAKKDEQGKDKAAQEASAASEEKKDEDQKNDSEKDKEKEKAKQAQALQEQENGKDPKGQEAKKAQSVLTQAELKQQEAERLLRSIDDKIGRYPLTDTEATGQRGKDGKNW